MRKLASGALFVVFAFVMMPTAPPATAADEDGQGCCSHHGGVCGCNGGHTMCCDNTQSPSCSCRGE